MVFWREVTSYVIGTGGNGQLRKGLRRQQKSPEQNDDPIVSERSRKEPGKVYEEG